MTTLVNCLEGGSSGTGVTNGNSGGASGNAFDAVTAGTGATVAYDSTHAAHGSLGLKIATGASTAQAFVSWAASIGSQSQVWFRLYLFITGSPSVNTRLWAAFQNTTACGGVRLNTNRTVTFTNAAGSAITGMVTSSVVPANTWVRFEGFLTGSATVGQVELKYFATADSSTATEALTSAATQNTTGSPNTFGFGFSATAAANIGPYWLDDVGVSSSGYIGPVQALTASLSGASSSAGTLGRQAAQAYAGTSSAAAALARQPGHTLPCTGTSAGSVARLAGKTASGTAGSGGSIGRQIASPLSATAAAPGALARRISQVSAGTASSAGTLTRQAAFLLTSAAASSASVARQVAKVFAAVVSVADSGAIAFVRAVVLALGALTSRWATGRAPQRWNAAPGAGTRWQADETEDRWSTGSSAGSRWTTGG